MRKVFCLEDFFIKKFLTQFFEFFKMGGWQHMGVRIKKSNKMSKFVLTRFFGVMRMGCGKVLSLFLGKFYKNLFL
jgi:hypothetical protein